MTKENKNTELWFSKEKERYFYTGLAICYGCKNILDKLAILVRRTPKDHVEYFCMDCSKKINQDVFLIRLVHLENKLPPDSLPVFRDVIELMTSRNSKKEIISVFDAATQSKHDEEIIDRCKIGNQSWEGASIGPDDAAFKEELAVKDDHELSDTELLDQMLDLKNFQILNSRFELEDKADDDKKRLE